MFASVRDTRASRAGRFTALLVATALSILACSLATRLNADDPSGSTDSERDAQKARDDSDFQDFLREIRRKSEPILAAMAKHDGYTLKPGQNLRRVAPPFADRRLEYYQATRPGEDIGAGPTAMVFRFREGQLTHSITWSSGEGYSLLSLLDVLLGIKSQRVEGGEVLNRSISGDWIMRVGVENDRLLQELEGILRQDLSLPVHIESREIERPVYIARGTYRFTPLEGGRTEEEVDLADKTIVTDPIEIYGKALVPNSGAGGGTAHKFDEFLGWLGDWVGKPIISEVSMRPKNLISWHLHAQSPSTDATRAEDHDPLLVLPNITSQTGLTFDLEQRRINTVFVEETE